MPISPQASFATWLHLEAPQKNTEKINKSWLSNIELVLTHMVLELGVLGITRKLSVPSVTLCQKIQKKLKFIAQELHKTQSTIIWLIGTSMVKFHIEVKTLIIIHDVKTIHKDKWKYLSFLYNILKTKFNPQNFLVFLLKQF